MTVFTSIQKMHAHFKYNKISNSKTLLSLYRPKILSGVISISEPVRIPSAPFSSKILKFKK